MAKGFKNIVTVISRADTNSPNYDDLKAEIMNKENEISTLKAAENLLMQSHDTKEKTINKLNAKIQGLETNLRNFERNTHNQTELENKINESVVNLKTDCSSTYLKLDNANSIIEHMKANAESKQTIVDITSKQMKLLSEKIDTVEKHISLAAHKRDDLITVHEPDNVNHNLVFAATMHQQPSVAIFHDSLCKKINETILNKEKVTTSKIWAPTFDDMDKGIDELEQHDAIVLQALTRSLDNLSAEEIVTETNNLVEKCLSKTDKVIISSIITRDDDNDINIKAELVNANLKYKIIKNPRVLICDNTNLRDRKFRIRDRVHLSDHGTSVFANNLKFKIAEALNVTVVKKRRNDGRWNNSGWNNNAGYMKDRNNVRDHWY